MSILPTKCLIFEVIMEALIASLHRMFHDNNQVAYYHAIFAVMENYDHYNDGSDY